MLGAELRVADGRAARPAAASPAPRRRGARTVADVDPDALEHAGARCLRAGRAARAAGARARSRCCPRRAPSACAAPSASWVLRVNRFGSIAMADSLSSRSVGDSKRATTRAADAGRARAGTDGARPRPAPPSRAAARRAAPRAPRSASRAAASSLFEREDALHAGERDAVVGELLDPAQQRDVALGVAAAAAGRARRREQALALVDAQRLRVHARELGRDRDHVQRSSLSAPSALPPVRAARREQRGARVVVERAGERLDRLALLARRGSSGTCTSTVTSRSPRLARCRRPRRPCPRTRSTLPLGVPGGMRTVTWRVERRAPSRRRRARPPRT